MIIGLYSPAAQSGKTTVARALQQRGYTLMPFAQPLRDMLSAMLIGMGMDSSAVSYYLFENKEACIPELGVSARHLLRTLGTEWGRDCVKPTIWVDHWLARASRKSFVVVDDVRFVNEANLIKDLGGQMWRITRPSVEKNTDHVSEGGLDAWEHFTYEIINSGTLHELLSGLPKVPLGANGIDPSRQGLEGEAQDGYGADRAAVIGGGAQGGSD
jgi:hypothetical protein